MRRARSGSARDPGKRKRHHGRGRIRPAHVPKSLCHRTATLPAFH
jgi:hypothetical protein